MHFNTIQHRSLRSLFSHFAFLIIGPTLLVHAQDFLPSRSSEAVIDKQAYKVIDRVVLSPEDTAQRPDIRGSVITKVSRYPEPAAGGIPAGRIGDGGVGCNGRVSTPPEPVTKTFDRIPGKDSPSLFSAITRVDISPDAKGGFVEVALFNFCGGWIFVPISPTAQLGDSGSLLLHRISLQFSNFAKDQVFLYGRPESPDSYRVLGLNQAVVITIPFTWSADGARPLREHRAISIDVYGLYDSGYYSSTEKSYHASSREYSVPSVPNQQ